jgi:hypothetical protein
MERDSNPRSKNTVELKSTPFDHSGIHTGHRDSNSQRHATKSTQTKRHATKSTQTKRHATKSTQTKRHATKSTQTKRHATKSHATILLTVKLCTLLYS